MNDKYFDKHNWKPKAFSTAKSINNFFEKNGITKKRIKRINTIGIAKNMQDENYIQTMRRTLADAGLPWDDIDSDDFPYADSTLIPCEVVICEPVVIVFDDNTTLEIKPTQGHQILMSVNQIDKDITDGLNNCNYNSDIMFNEVIGSGIRAASVLVYELNQDNGYFNKDYRTKTEFEIDLDNKNYISLFFEQGYDGRFRFGLYKHNYIMNFGRVKETIPFPLVKQAAYDNIQVEIVAGHDSSSYFWIMPVKHSTPTEENPEGVFEHRYEEISIEEDDVGTYLYYYLKKYFDVGYEYGKARDEGCKGFEWYLTYNFYSYETMNKMLQEIEEKALLLANDFENKKLEPLTKHFHYSDFLPSNIRWSRNYTEEEQKEIIKNNIGIAVNFYKRFVRTMRSMMENSPEYNIISFMGP